MLQNILKYCVMYVIRIVKLSRTHTNTLTYDGITLPESITQRKTHSAGYGKESRNVSFNSQDLETDFIFG